MSADFKPIKPFKPAEFPNDGRKPFPIVEVFGYDRHLMTDEARRAFTDRHCPFVGGPCEKFRQHGYGYCSVLYRGERDQEAQVYAVCDHRLDGVPVQTAVFDYFGRNDRVRMIEELKLSNPSQSFDFIAIDPQSDDFIGIETQAIDLRGGGVGPAWVSLMDGKPSQWRERFTAEATAKGRKDTVAYGVNMANITKRLGVQVAEKGALFKKIGAKLYVVTQDRCFRYFCDRIPTTWSVHGEAWDIAFLTFDYTGELLPAGRWEIAHIETKRTTLKSFSDAIGQSTADITRDAFLRRIKAKLK